MKILTILMLLFICFGQANYFKQAEYEGWFSFTPVIGDADNDSYLEVYDPCFNPEDSTIMIVREYNGFQFQATHLDFWARPWDIGDINGNGLIDLVCQYGDPGLGGNGYIQIYEQRSPNQLPDSLIYQITLPGAKILHYSRYADTDQDGKQEIVMSPNGMSGGGGLSIYEWDNNGLNLICDLPGNGYCNRKAIGDFDNDGQLEIVYSDFNVIHVVECFGDNSYQEVWNYDVANVNLNGPTVALDFDGDDQDEFVSCFSGSQLGFRYLVFHWDGSTYELWHDLGGPAVGGAGLITCTVGDFDNDNRDEFVAGVRIGQQGNSHPEVRVYDYNSGSVDYQIISQYPQTLCGAYTADFDRDGQSDIYLIYDTSFGQVEFYAYQGTAVNEFRIPNPNKTTLKIFPTIGRQFNVQTDERVLIYDANGRLVKKIQAGIYQPDLPNGIYWLKTETTQQVQKIIILK